MHEIAIVKDIFKTLEQAYPETYHQISKIKIQAGLLCNVQPILIQNAFEAFVLEETRFRETELEIELLPIIAYCKSCTSNFEVRFHKFVCSCGQPSDQIVQGEELRISQVIFNDQITI
ncbi:hydrogenase maturation nickel metallochaperone HypA [Pedobacter gandavensis]|uniref:hydrogenase maturation nickel metallochaperone HypA/HybF n=1 Tax=Pedobacter TaxID=84567 RepID=UPI001C99D2A7|nr:MULTISPECIES: hydrogenase maturation nickel metallochaperone HypA [Pedobacter]WGQ09977.1 hydrogenase maturation nickel metallochaperone HypA [Pedobacter gandavensis]